MKISSRRAVCLGLLPSNIPKPFRIWYTHPKGCSAARSNKATRYRKEADALRPFSTTPKWKSFEGFLRRAAFAVTMGAASLVVFAILWSLSVPWIAWRIWCLVHPAVRVGFSFLGLVCSQAIECLVSKPGLVGRGCACFWATVIYDTSTATFLAL